MAHPWKDSIDFIVRGPGESRSQEYTKNVRASFHGNLFFDSMHCYSLATDEQFSDNECLQRVELRTERFH